MHIYIFACFSRTRRRSVYHYIKKKKWFVNCNPYTKTGKNTRTRKYKLDTKLKTLKLTSAKHQLSLGATTQGQRDERPLVPQPNTKGVAPLWWKPAPHSSLAKFHKKNNDCVDSRLPMLLKWWWNLAFLTGPLTQN